MTILVLGGTGLVGRALVAELERRGRKVLAPGRDRFDAAKAPLPRLFLDGVGAVVNAIVVKDGSAPLAERINTLFPHELAGLCAEAGIPLIHLSTDAVFTPANGPHDEAKPADAADAYGRQKAMGEPQGALVLRFSVVGPGRPGLLEWLRGQKGEVTGFTDHLWNGLAAPTLAEAIATLLEGPVVPGLRHLFSDSLDKAKLLELLASAYGLPVSVRRACAPTRRDQRLATIHPEFLSALALPPLERQIAAMALEP